MEKQPKLPSFTNNINIHVLVKTRENYNQKCWEDNGPQNPRYEAHTHFLPPWTRLLFGRSIDRIPKCAVVLTSVGQQ